MADNIVAMGHMGCKKNAAARGGDIDRGKGRVILIQRESLEGWLSFQSVSGQKEEGKEPLRSMHESNPWLLKSTL